MATRKIDSTFYEETGKRLRNTSQLKLFNLLKDDDGDKFMNIFKSYELNEDVETDASLFDKYEVDNDDWWDNISYKFYGTPYLWWVLPLYNNMVNPFEDLEEGDTINVLKEEYMYVLLTDIEEISEL